MSMLMTNAQKTIPMPREFKTCLRRDVTVLEFSPEFMMWAVIQTLHQNQELQLLCNGWEL